MNLSFKLKGSLFTLSVLQLQTTDLTLFAEELKAKIHLAPNFFNNTPMVLDIQALPDKNIDFTKLNALLKKNKIIPVGIRGAREDSLETLRKLGLAIMADSPKNEADAGGSANFAQGTKIINDTIRSGQRVCAEQGDLIVLGAVSSGAELLADGNIHVYGPLRGRALAGINGNTHARIFCQTLAAELVSIAGIYQIFEHIDELTRSPTQIYLNNNELIIARLKMS